MATKTKKGKARQRVANQSVTLSEDQREQIVDELVNNCDCQHISIWKDSDIPLLNGTDDARLVDLLRNQRNIKAMENELVNNEADEDEDEFDDSVENEDDSEMEDDDEEEVVGKKGKKTNNEELDEESDTDEVDLEDILMGRQPQRIQNARRTQVQPAGQRQLTENEFFALAPPSVLEDLAFARNFRTQQKGQLIRAILTANRDAFTKQELMSMPQAGLEKLAKLATNGRSRVTANYAGANGGGEAPAPEFKEGDVLPIPPTINWAEIRKAERTAQA